MSDHKITLDIQKIALAMQAIKAQIEVLESMIQQALLKENRNE